MWSPLRKLVTKTSKISNYDNILSSVKVGASSTRCDRDSLNNHGCVFGNQESIIFVIYRTYYYTSTLTKVSY